MSNQKITTSILNKIIKAFLSVNEKAVPNHNEIKNVLIVRQHNQFGDLLASVSLFRAVKETLPQCRLTVITSPQNYYAVSKNKYINEQFVFDKSKLLNPHYLYSLISLLRKGYDLVIVPVTVAISDTSSLLGRCVRSKYRIGPASLNGVKNKFSFLFNCRVDMNWSISSERHVSEFGLDIIKPIGITTANYKSEISFDENDNKSAEDFLNSLLKGTDKKIIGFHIGAGKPPNRWPVEKFIKLSEMLKNKFNCDIYLTGSSSDQEEINKFNKFTNNSCGLFINKSIPEVASLISKSDLFITNDTGIMHVAGATNVPQISLFGPTNPNNWAPIGDNKINIKNTDSINEISIDQVFESAKKIMDK